jgi:hypothetical protein
MLLLFQGPVAQGLFQNRIGVLNHIQVFGRAGRIQQREELGDIEEPAVTVIQVSLQLSTTFLSLPRAEPLISEVAIGISTIIHDYNRWATGVFIGSAHVYLCAMTEHPLIHWYTDGIYSRLYLAPETQSVAQFTQRIEFVLGGPSLDFGNGSKISRVVLSGKVNNTAVCRATFEYNQMIVLDAPIGQVFHNVDQLQMGRTKAKARFPATLS